MILHIHYEDGAQHRYAMDKDGALKAMHVEGKDFFAAITADPADPRSLTDIVKDIAQHQVDAPTHGISCVCMDKYVHELRMQIFHGLNTFNTDWPVGFDMKRRVGYVLNSIYRAL